MARKNKQDEPKLHLETKTSLFPYGIRIRGSGWGHCPVEFLVDGQGPVRPARVIQGDQELDRVKPARGAFLVAMNLPELPPGLHRIVARGVSAKGSGIEAEVELEVAQTPETERNGKPTHRWHRRRQDFFRRRFPLGYDPRPGGRLRALEHRDAMRRRQAELDPDAAGAPVDPGCNWTCIGPTVVRDGQVFSGSGSYTTAPISGRVTSIAIDPNDTDVVYAAAAQGGVWKSVDRGANWAALSDYEISLAVGCVTIDPSTVDSDGRSTRILVGTGEPNFSDSYYGAGMLFSDDGGQTWSARGTGTFLRDAFSTIAVDPGDSTHLFAATDTGVFESTDSGLNWTLLESGLCYDLVVDWTKPSGPWLFVGRSSFGVRHSQDGGATWTTLGGGLPASAGRIALAMAPSAPGVLYAAFANGSGGLTGIYKSSDAGVTWAVTASAPTGVAQSSYNLVLGVHPTDSNTVLFGEVHLWRTSDGGVTWTRVSTGSPGIHADQHAIEFHPTDGTQVYVGNDGGVWYSSDGGSSYEHRNKDLATLQYFGIAHHPDWDAVILGGTQDNGAQRYLGHPAWQHSALGDGAFAAINETTDKYRWYETRWWGFPCFRSDTAGSPGSWSTKASGISTNSNWFYPPLEMDPSDSSALYCGYDRLFRTSNHGNSWTAITPILVDSLTNITAIAIAPSDSNVVYCGMQDGSVFRVDFSGGSWTATDLTSGPLPAGQISDIAVHPSDPDTVYATTSNLIFSEGVGEFTNDHVFRSTDGGTTWTNASSGLAQSNPINSVAIDPADPQTIFLGADVGIFRSDDAGASWYVWDEGLPNCSVQDVQAFGPKRLLRAATHGRSVWERPIDAATCPTVDIYLRDDEVDTGRTQPTPSGVPHPFESGVTVRWYKSVDIKIDSPDPVANTYESSGLDIDYLQFEELERDNPRRDTWVRTFVQVHNRGIYPATNVKVRAFWANAHGGLPDLPADFWTAFPNTDPTDTSVWHPIGTAQTIDALDPSLPGVVGWTWHVPDDAPTHSCMLAAITCDEDGVTTTSLVIHDAVRNDNNVTLRNLHVDDVIIGAQGVDPSGPHFIDFAFDAKRRPMDVVFDTGSLPKGTVIEVFFPKFESVRPSTKAYPGLRKRTVKGRKLGKRPEEVCRGATKYDTKTAYVLEVDDKRRDVRSGLYGVVPKGERFSAALIVHLPKKTTPGRTYVFDVEHWVGGREVGGSSYSLRVAPKC